jgi:hypothetical protein
MASVGRIKLADVAPNHLFVGRCIVLGMPKPPTLSKDASPGTKPVEDVKELHREGVAKQSLVNYH